MQISRRTWLAVWLSGLLIVSIPPFARAPLSIPQAHDPAEIPIAKGGSGACTADFVVTDSAGKGIYDAKIHIEIKYGFGGFHRLDVTVGTNFEGKARIEGLPEQIKKTAEFSVAHAGESKTLPYDPQANCHPRHEVILGAK